MAKFTLSSLSWIIIHVYLYSNNYSSIHYSEFYAKCLYYIVDLSN